MANTAPISPNDALESFASTAQAVAALKTITGNTKNTATRDAELHQWLDRFELSATQLLGTNAPRPTTSMIREIHGLLRKEKTLTQEPKLKDRLQFSNLWTRKLINAPEGPARDAVYEELSSLLSSLDKPILKAETVTVETTQPPAKRLGI